MKLEVEVFPKDVDWLRDALIKYYSWINERESESWAANRLLRIDHVLAQIDRQGER